MTSIYEKKISAEVRLIHVKQTSLYNFVVLRKKTKDTAEDETSQARHFKSMGIYGFSSTDLYSGS